MKIKAYRNRIRFVFEDVDFTRVDGHSCFKYTTEAGIVYRDFNQSANDPMWGTVVDVGEGVEEETGIRPGAKILIEALGWSNKISDPEAEDGTPMWFTEPDKVMCVIDPV